MIQDKLSLETARSLWKESERQMYPLAVADAPRYQRIITIVRALADDMRQIDSIDDLIGHWPQAHEMLLGSATTHAFSTGGLPIEQVTGAAFALREREIMEQNSRKLLMERINKANLEADIWVTLDEAGNVNSGLMDPYRCTEMHLATGLALMSMTQSDPSTGEPIFVISVIKLDPVNGNLLDSSPGIEDWSEHSQQRDFITHRTQVREKIDLMKS
jgi:hypothetical protein